MLPEIGTWVKREDEVHYKHMRHLVESIVNGEAITHCGRSMAPKTKKGVGLVDGGDAPVCKQCEVKPSV